ncbi:hypothetical protein, partial [Phenylobacterium sp.]|uniref:hypothetical protein n=1 Tax=Phenylobacterium sp. TaxID=1871053 RepID=UPI002ED81FFD
MRVGEMPTDIPSADRSAFVSTGDTLEEIVRAIAALPEPRGWIGAPRGMAGVSAVPEPASWALMIL